MSDCKKYKILLVHNFYQKPGGEDTVFRNEKKLLENNGHEVVTYTRDNSELNGNFLKKIFLPIVTIFNPKTYFDIKKIIKEQDIDIVHVHNTLCLISPSVFYAAKKMKKPVIQTLHNYRMQCPNGLFYRDGHICEECINCSLISSLKHKCYRNSFLQTLAIVLMLKIHRCTDIFKKVNFICLTDFSRNKSLLLNFEKQTIDEKRVYVKPNFVFKHNFSQRLNSNDNNIKHISDDKNYYLYVGRLDEIKGIDVALEAFSKMPEKELHVIGCGGGNLVTKYSIYRNIKFLGQLSHDKVLYELENCLALVFSSKCYETFGMTIIEAYSCRAPVLANYLGTAKEMVYETVTGYHYYNSSNSLIETVRKFENFDIAVLKENAYNMYKNQFDEKNAYEKLITIYKAICNL